MRVTHIHHMNQEVGILKLIERGPKGARQVLRELPEKTHRIRDDDLALLRKTEPAGGGIQGGKQEVVGEDLALGEGIEEGGLTRIGISYNRDDRYPGLKSFRTALAMGPGQMIDLCLQTED